MNNQQQETQIMESGMADKQLNQSRRGLLAGTVLGVSAVGLTQWRTPTVKAMVLPAHAVTSCPEIMVDDVLITTPSPQSQDNPVCGITFDIFSSDMSVPIEIVSVTTSVLGSNVAVVLRDELPYEVSMTQGTRVTWTGPAAGAPFCNADSLPVENVIFTITARCDLLDDYEYSLDIDLFELYDMADLGNPV